MTLQKTAVTVLVPAAGTHLMPISLGACKKDGAFINVGTKLAIERIVDFFCDKINVTILLAVANSEYPLFQLRPFKNLSIISVGQTTNVCDTVLKALVNVTSEWCLINPITTVPTSDLSSDGVIFFGQELIPKEDWSSITLRGIFNPVFHVKSEEDSFGLPSFPFTGRIFAKTSYIRNAIEQLANSEKSDLIYVAKSLFEAGHVKIRYERWLDAGHSATYADSKVLSISSRHFNKLFYNKSTNTISKTSLDHKKLKNEGKFYLESPPVTRRFFPSIISSREVGDKWELEMEYIGYPSLAELYLHSDIGVNSWRRIIQSLILAFDTFYAGNPLLVEDCQWLYTKKTLARQRNLEGWISNNPEHPLFRIYASPFTVNSNPYPSIKSIIKLLIEQLYIIERSRPLYIGHGDLCFNNILADPLFGNLKLIDPKAQIHDKTGLCGLVDPLYDLAKLNHSFCSFYDSIVNNLYMLRWQDSLSLNFYFYTPPHHKEIQQMFQDMLLLERTDEHTCKLATANLFLSMLPLHIEDPERMIALAILGSHLIINNSLEDLLLKA